MSDYKQITFSKEELSRYSRHIIIPSFNIDGQKKLKAAKVLVIGSGGLGSPLLLYLTAAGVGTIGIVDFDAVDDSNLQRQVLFTIEDIGKPKVEAAKKRLEALNPNIRFIIHNLRLDSTNALELFKNYDVVADGTDNFPTRYLVNDACVLTGKPNVYASIFQFDGQVSVFNYRGRDGNTGPNYRCLYPSPPPPGLVPSCAEGGVLGVLPGIIGSIQALEVIKVVTGVGEPLSGKLFLFDALTFTTRTLNITKDENNPINGKNPTIKTLIDYEQFCGIGGGSEDTDHAEKNKEIEPAELKKLIDDQKDIQIVDVREDYEFEIANIGGDLIPLSEIPFASEKISRTKQVVFLCRTGKRSAVAIQELEKKFGFTNLYNLRGGILAYAEEADSSLAIY